MAKQRKSNTTTTAGTLDARDVLWAPKERHPSQVSGLFQDDPTFEEFRAILRPQRAEDYRRANEAIDAILARWKALSWWKRHRVQKPTSRVEM